MSFFQTFGDLKANQVLTEGSSKHELESLYLKVLCYSAEAVSHFRDHVLIVDCIY